MPGNMISKGDVFVIDADTASREHLSRALRQKDYEVVCFADGPSLLSEAKVRLPACVLLDVPAPDRCGLDVLKRLRADNCPAPILVTSAHGSIAMAVTAIKSGAFDFIAKPFEGTDVVDRVDAAIDQFAQIDQNRQRWLAGCEPLTDRERVVLGHLAAGQTNKEIARLMCLSARTIEGYRASVLKKAGARNVTDMLRRLFGQS